MVTVTESVQYTNFLDLEEVKDWIQFPATEIVRERKLRLLMEAACVGVAKWCGRPLARTEIVERFDGWGGEFIMLNYKPVLELVSVSEFQSSGNVRTLSESTPESPIEGVQLDYQTGKVMRVFSGYSWGRSFFPGARNITFTYTAGYNPLPADLRIAVLELVKWWWVNTQETSLLRGPPVEYGGGPESQTPGLWTGVPNRIRMALEPYRKISIG